ncbi:MAG: tetratricopeptide repeat protein [Magnetococcales bacterium]|nr:tetratricopeptide repeat protein [Magnetococcales bacterium]
MDKARLIQKLQEALRIHDSGNAAAADPVYQEVVQALPEFADAWYLWGLVAQDLGQHEEAVFRFGRAIAIGGEQADILHHLGISLQSLGRLQPAAQCLRTALSLAPGNPECLASLGNVALELNDLQQAESCYLQVLTLKEHFPQVHYNLGTLYRGQSRDDKASYHFRRTLELDDEHWKAHFSLGLLLQFDNQTVEAIAHFSRAVQINPNYSRARWAMHLALPTFFNDEEEMVAARKRWFLGVAALQQMADPEGDEALEEVRHACESMTNFHLHYQGLNDLAAQKAQGILLTRMAHLIFPGHDVPLSVVARPDGKIHVAFVSSFLYGHSVFKTHARFITCLDRNRFFVHVFYTGTLQDASLRSIMRGCDDFHEIGPRSARLIAAIRATNPDILIYTDLGMDPTLNLVSALRLAPIQCNAGGHPITSGLQHMDYFLSSDAMEVDHAQEHYSETLIRLPNLAHCYPTPQVHWAIGPPGVERTVGDVVYCNLQNLIKLLPRHDAIYPAIALEVPGSRFWFIDVGGGVGALFRKRLQRAFADRGLDSEQYCQLFPKMDLHRFFGLIRASDVILDGISWSGNNSSMEALAFGKPIVTLPGEMFRSRHTHGILKRLGVMVTQGNDVAEYVAIAVRLGRDIGFRSAVMRMINERKSVLYEDEAPVRGLERALEAMVAREL